MPNWQLPSTQQGKWQFATMNLKVTDIAKVAKLDHLLTLAQCPEDKIKTIQFIPGRTYFTTVLFGPFLI